MEVELVKYNRERAPAFRIETSIVKGIDGRYVRKRALCPEAEEHIRSLPKKRDLLYSLKNVRAPEISLDDGTAMMRYIEGESFEAHMIKKISIGDMKGFKEICEGKHDDIPEQAFYMVGTIEEVLEKAKQMASA